MHPSTILLCQTLSIQNITMVARNLRCQLSQLILADQETTCGPHSQQQSFWAF